MRIITRTLIFVIAVVLDSFGLPTTSLENRPYEIYNENLPNFLAYAPIVPLRYPPNPEGELGTLMKYINNEYVPCDKNTIILRRGPAIFGWKNQNWIAALFQFHPHHGYNRVIYDEELREQKRVSLAFLIAMGVGKDAPPLVEKKRRSTSRILECLSLSCGRHIPRET